MMLRHVAWGIVVIGIMTVLALPSVAVATTAFSRQVHADCRTCHFQGTPALNAYGRAFKMNGFSESAKMRAMRKHREEKKKQKQERDKAARMKR